MSQPILRTLRLVQQTRPTLRTTPLFTRTHPRATLSTLSFNRRQPRPFKSKLFTTTPKRHTSSQTQPPQEPTSQPLGKLDQPSYSLTFTCRPCSTRSTHTVTKQAYHSGTVLIQCPECKNRHLIADHLKIFSDKRITLEDILGAKGEAVKYGVVNGGEEGDLEVLPGKKGEKGE